MTDAADPVVADAAAMEHAAELLAASHDTVVLVGAGMSKESGIPTFRGEGGLWTVRGEPPLNQYDAFRDDAKRWWERRLEQQREAEQRRAEQGDDDFGRSLESAVPNAGHHALAEFEAMGVVRHVITQNIDNLHREAGQRSLTEIHGNRLLMRCVACEARWPREKVEIDPEQLPPRCTRPGCNGVIKGDTVMFGEPIPPSCLVRSEEETMRADVFMSVGTSALVYPAAQYPAIAVQRGVPLIEVNPEPTPLSPLATAILRGPSGDVLPALLQATRERRAS